MVPYRCFGCGRRFIRPATSEGRTTPCVCGAKGLAEPVAADANEDAAYTLNYEWPTPNEDAEPALAPPQLRRITALDCICLLIIVAAMAALGYWLARSSASVQQ